MDKGFCYLNLTTHRTQDVNAGPAFYKKINFPNQKNIAFQHERHSNHILFQDLIGNSIYT